MSHSIEISDDVYEHLKHLATQQGRSPGAVVESLITYAEEAGKGRRYYELDDWFRHLGMTDDEMAEADAELEAEEAAEEAADADAR